MKYDPRGSGIVLGSGGRRRFGWRPHPTNHFPDIRLTEGRKQLLAHIPEYKEGLDYTDRELTLLAERILMLDEKSWDQPPVIINAEQYKERLKREIYTQRGTPDPSIVQGMYWRTHPNGRRYRSDETRRNNKASFYK